MLNFSPTITFNGFIRGNENQSIKDKTEIWGNYVHGEMKLKNCSIMKFSEAIK